jgi:beta-galactosidase
MDETMKNRFRISLISATVVLMIAAIPVPGADQSPQPAAAPAGRERLLMDFGWRFAFGHATDPAKDYSYASSYFSYFAKTGNGAGPAGSDYDDSDWRKLNLPHDWAVEVPFDNRGTASHGYKAVGRNSSETSVGWYRKAFILPTSDLGKRISVQFDGVFRDSRVWVNGHYLGNEESGYTSFARNISEFLNYGGNNVIAVRVDASIEEGWFYEGAGIYRHVWLVKTDPLHVARYGTFVTSELKTDSADVTARVSVINEGTNTATFDIEQKILDANGKTIATALIQRASLAAGNNGSFTNVIAVANPKLWSIETPHLHKLVTTIKSGASIVDQYETPFGIRSIRFDPNEGFFLNGKRVELKGSNNHQDHAGVGAAIPDALQDFRIAQLKKIGCNAYRCSHNPPTPEMLDACDRLGMVVIDENRLMGTADYHFSHLREMMLRDRNHPSVILWSVGNEEWAIEGNEKGERITVTMQAWAKQMDTTRPITVAISGGWGRGSSKIIEVMGYNYIKHGNTDQQHKQFPNQPGVGAEEVAFTQTRGIYADDRPKCHLRAYDWDPSDWGSSAEAGWSYYAARPYLAGLFVWTGFDYRGEPTPFGWPAISSQFGILDTCGFPKDAFYYFKSWWTDAPVLHIFPHWNWPGREGQEISVWAYSNCEEVELFLNGQSLGRKAMKKNSHLEWPVKYAPGTLLARGYKGGQEITTAKVETTGALAAIQLTPHRAAIKADGEDVSVITVQVNDTQGRLVPTAGNEITFALTGPGKIIGVGNGDPSSHETDKFVEKVSSLSITNWRRNAVDSTENRPEVSFDFDDSAWQSAAGGRGGGRRGGNTDAAAQTNVYRGAFELPQPGNGVVVSLMLRSLGEQHWVYLNGQAIAQNVRRDAAGHEFKLDPALLRAGKNVIAVIATPSAGGAGRGQGGRGGGGNPPAVRMVTSPGDWKRSVFNGLAQVIVQSTQQPGEIALKASSPGMSSIELKQQAQATALRLAVP